MSFFIDRRANPRDKSLVNRRRFLRRARGRLREIVDQSIKDRAIADIAKGKKVSIPAKGIQEPRLRSDNKGGSREHVLPGNHSYQKGDEIAKPTQGEGGSGKQGADSGDGEDAFEFTLTGQEFLDIFFDNLALPHLVKKDLHRTESTRMHRAGHTVVGSPANLDLKRTMKNSLARRRAFSRPQSDETKQLQKEIWQLEGKSNLSPADLDHLRELRSTLQELQGRPKGVPFIDPFDIRYCNFEVTSEPSTAAVMFCLMDVSASMGEREKELAKRFFILLHLFLKRHYQTIDVVFVRHTHVAEEVDEEKFFYSRESGGTVVSTGLAEIAKIIEDRYPKSKWNIYIAQASDGENFSDDSEHCTHLLNSALMPLAQYYAYVEIADERELPILMSSPAGGVLWQAYNKVAAAWPNFAMRRITDATEIYPVFHELFAKDGQAA